MSGNIYDTQGTGAQQIITDQGRNTLLGRIATLLGTLSPTQANSLQIPWTPTLVSSGGGAPVYTAQNGYLSKWIVGAGFLNFVQARVAISGLGTLAAGTLTLATLPVAAIGTTNAVSVLEMRANGITVSGGNTYFHGLINPGDTAITLAQGGSTTAVTITVSQLTAGVNTFTVSGVYVSAT